VLDKPGPLTHQEYESIKQHTVQGVHMVEPLRSLRKLIPLIRSHHERMDGTGYPDRLPAAEIPLSVRILSVADVYVALSSARSYRPALPHQGRLHVLQNDAATGGLDASLVRMFC